MYNIDIAKNQKYNIKIGQRGYGQTYYLRRKYLLNLNFNINSIGFDYWILATFKYEKKKMSMMTLYTEIAKVCNTTANRVERAMRHSSINAKEKIKELYKYNGKISNSTILNLLTKFPMEV